MTDGTVNPRPTSNFFNISIGTPPSSIFCVAVFDEQPEEFAHNMREGNFIVIRNVRVAAHKRTAELELRWSDKLTEDQLQKGWKQKTITPVPKNDHRATQINQWVDLHN